MEISQQQGVQMGNRLAVYRPGTGRIILLAVVLIILGLPCAIFGVRIDVEPTVYSNSSSLGGWLTTVGAVLILVAIVALILVLGNRKLRVDLYEQGFVLTNKKGRKEIFWEEITQVWHKREELFRALLKIPVRARMW